MTDQHNEIEQEIREQIRRAKAPPRRTGGAKRMLTLVLVLLVVLGIVWAASYRDEMGLDGMRRLFTYNKAASGEDGRVELFRYDSDRSAIYDMLGDSLIIASTTRLQLLGKDGVELWSETVNFTHPAIVIGAQTAAVYDVGGTELYLISAHGLLRGMSEQTGNGILSVSINASDYLALTSLKSGYRSAVTAYTSAGEPVFTYNSSERYISDACVLDDNRHLCAVTMGEADGVFASRLSFYGFDSEDELSETILGSSMVLLLSSFGRKVAALEDDRLTLFASDGSLAGSCRYEYPYLRGQTMGGADFAVLALSRYRSGSAMRVVTVDSDGQVLGRVDGQREILDVSAAGRYVAVLCSDRLTVYTADMTEYASLDATDYAKQVIMRSDGTAVLIGASRAWLFVP
ncbi:MAG: hypothetical protein IKN81_04490 [Oscillospiraceae bacterium]|nr:hypothetical protein [Oscillospiraceae bacterium]